LQQVTLSNWISNAVYINSRERLKFQGRMWAPALFDTFHRRRLWLMSRQVGKSTNGAAEGVARGAKYKGFRTLYVAPVEDQAGKFSKDKVGPMIEFSPVIRQQVLQINNVYEKHFRSGGRYYFKYAKHNPDNVRGITCDMVHYDEIQDQDLDAIVPVVDEAMFTSKWKLRIFSGTPKSFANQAHKLWLDSDQREWVIRCRRHTPNKFINVGIRNIGKHGPICHHCGGLLDTDDGIWVKHNPLGLMAGFHIHQLICKISHESPEEWKEILIKLEKYSEAKFMNEVLGMSADTAEMPLTERHFQVCSDKDLDLTYEPPASYFHSNLYAGIDWGHGEAATALAIGQFHHGKFRYLFFKKYEEAQCDPDFCIPDMVSILKKFRVSRIHCDYGGGFGLNKRLAGHFEKGALTTNVWSDSALAGDEQWAVKNQEVPRLTLNKSKIFANYIQDIHFRKFVFPRWDSIYPHFIKDFLNVRKEEDRSEKVRYVKAGNDDLFQAAIYCYVIAKADFNAQMF
jgi:hypothetical protein